MSAEPFQLFDALPRHIEDALRASIERFGVLVPVTVDQHGQVLDGSHRKRIAEQLGVPYDRLVRVCDDDDERREIARTLNADRRQLTDAQRRKVAIDLRQQGHSERAIAGALGTSKTTIHRDLSTGPDGPVPDRIKGLDGKSRPARKQVYVRNDREQKHAQLTLTSKTSGPTAAQKINQGITNEWHTPAKYIDAARTVLGAIDLDPASSAEANETVRAAAYYHEGDDGLGHDWTGRVWLNPPYGSAGPEFVTRLIEQYQRQSVTAAIAVLNSNAVPTKWFRPLWDYLLCFHYGRINFNAGTEERTGATHGSVFVYLGDDADLFDEVFSEFGIIVQRRRPR